jgi:hypothetical protein
MENNQSNQPGNEETHSHEKSSHPMMDQLKKVKSNIEHFAKEANISQLQDSVKSVVKEAQKDFSKLVNKDLVEVKKKFEKEKAQIEKTFKSVMTKEMSAAKKFIQSQKKEISALQNRLEKLMASKKKSSMTKTVKKTAKKVSKKASKKK